MFLRHGFKLRREGIIVVQRNGFRKLASAVAVTSIAVAGISVAWSAPAMASDPVILGCAPEDPVYKFKAVTRSTRPTNVASAYITGPGTITYNKTTSATASASASASVTAEAGVVFAKASATIGVTVTGSKSWSDSFSYTLEVPSGKKRRMRLHQESRMFDVVKMTFNTSSCTYKTAYSATANAPRTDLVEEWRLEA
jgi:hypothetical protein